MSRAIEIMVHYVENIRRIHEREHSELEEARYAIVLKYYNGEKKKTTFIT